MSAILLFLWESSGDFMSRPRGRENPDRVTIKTALTQNRVNNYYKVLNMSRDTWLKGMTPTQRYEAALNDLLDKLEQAKGTLEDLEGLDDWGESTQHRGATDGARKDHGNAFEKSEDDSQVTQANPGHSRRDIAANKNTGSTEQWQPQ